jgi:periplasmic divalent cation tolerance protein
MLIVFTTTPSLEEAETLARQLVDSKLSACVQVVPQITSFYSWEGKTQKGEEWLLLIKTADEKYAELEAFIEANHSYDVPEIAAVKVEKVSAKYEKWLKHLLDN